MTIDVLLTLSWSMTVWLVILVVVALLAFVRATPWTAEPTRSGGDEPPPSSDEPPGGESA